MSHCIDLMPEEYQTARAATKRLYTRLCAGIVVLIVLLLLAASLHEKARLLQAKVIPLRDRVASMRVWEAQLPAARQRLEYALKQQSTTNMLCHEPFWSGLLSDLAMASGKNVRVTQLSVTRDASDIDADGKGIDQFNMFIAGEAASRSDFIEFMSRLGASEHVREIALEVSRNVESELNYGMMEFSLRGTLK